MTMISAMANGRCEAVVDALRVEYGATLAARIIEAEAADFLWDARLKDRYLGQHFSFENDDEELSRIAILSFLARRWHVGLCLVDGEGSPVELVWKRTFYNLEEAESAFGRAV